MRTMKFSALAAVTAAGLAFTGLSAAAPASATLPSGEGMIRYHPTEGVVVAAWDYIAETD